MDLRVDPFLTCHTLTPRLAHSTWARRSRGRCLSEKGPIMPVGTIARLLIDKGFGFIRDESGVEHFFHRSAVRGAVFELLREGQRVDFSSEDSPKGPRAGEVRLLDG